jgi:hypothetical protein
MSRVSVDTVIHRVFRSDVTSLVTITIQENTPAIIVLARADTRSWSDIQGPYAWSFDFTIYRKGEKTLLGSSTHDWYYKRSVTLELSLTPGEYVVHVSL